MRWFQAWVCAAFWVVIVALSFAHTIAWLLISNIYSPSLRLKSCDVDPKIFQATCSFVLEVKSVWAVKSTKQLAFSSQQTPLRADHIWRCSAGGQAGRDCGCCQWQSVLSRDDAGRTLSQASYLRAAAPAADPGKRGKEERAWATFPIYIYLYIYICVCVCVPNGSVLKWAVDLRWVEMNISWHAGRQRVLLLLLFLPKLKTHPAGQGNTVLWRTEQRQNRAQKVPNVSSKTLEKQ